MKLASHPDLEAKMHLSREEWRRRREICLGRRGFSRVIRVYLAELEAGGRLVKPIGSLTELLTTPRWPGRRVYHARSGQAITWSGSEWQLQSKPRLTG